ncbi:MAG: RnfABCDGE type electron transport complex subunit D [Rikenellaceae bacterium]
MANKLLVAPSPHVHSSESTSRIMRDVIFALVPAFVVSVIYFGVSALVVTLVSILSCVLFEFLIQKYLIKGECTICNYSAVVTGLLLGFNLPANIPLWIVVIGALVAIGVAKMTYGGLGKNPFNPALVGRVFLLIAYPAQMTVFPSVDGYTGATSTVDGISGATPLAVVKDLLKDSNLSLGHLDLPDMLLGAVPGSLGEVSALCLILGGIYLLWRKVISWHIPVAVLGTMVVMAFVNTLAIGGSGALLFQMPLFHILAGGALLGSIYMATDYSTSPMTHKGMLIYGVGIGFITMWIRLNGAYPEGMSFAILLMNACVPLINKYVKPKRFGAIK